MLLLGAAAAPANAQDRPHRVWVAAGLGGGGGQDVDGVGLMAQIVYERAPHHFALRALGLTDLESGGLSEIGLLYGRFGGGGIAHASVAAGLSAVYLDCDGSQDACATVGLPLAADVLLTPLYVIGIGLQVFANVNLQSPYAGLFVTIPIGWMP